MNKSLILICLATHSSLSPLHRGQVELVCILIMVFNIVLDIILPYVSSNKSCGPFSISTSLLKTLKGVLPIPLQLLFNHSFPTGLVPDQFKVVRVVPIHKKRSSFLVSNNRPISLLSIFNKVIEKLMYNFI